MSIDILFWIIIWILQILSSFLMVCNVYVYLRIKFCKNRNEIFISCILVYERRLLLLKSRLIFFYFFQQEMAERHDMNTVLNEARSLVAKVQNLIDTKY